MDDRIQSTLAVAAGFASDQRTVFGEIWFERFRRAIDQENLELIHDLILASVQMAHGTKEMQRALREVDEEMECLARQNWVYQ